MAPQYVTSGNHRCKNKQASANNLTLQTYLHLKMKLHSVIMIKSSFHKPL